MKSFFEAAAAGVAGRPAADWLLSGLGVSAAAIAASFAIAMVATGPGSVRVSGDFPIFAAWDARSRATTVLAPAFAPAAVRPRSAPAAGLADPDIDFAPTGSIGPQGPPTGRGAEASPPAPTPRRLDGFVLRDVFDGKALVEAGNRLRIVEPGSLLEDAGRVLAIRRQGPHWVVETDTGTIGGPPEPRPLRPGSNPG